MEAIGTIRVALLAQEENHAALNDLITLAVRQHEALRFYADARNYLDGVPMHEHEGLLQLQDDGLTARLALGDDIPLGPARTRPEVTYGNDRLAG